MAGRVRGFETVGDMLRSLAVVGVFVAVVVLITFREAPAKVQVVDATPVLAAVAEAAPYTATLPGPEPAGWRVTSARVTDPEARPYSWYVGYLTDSNSFVAVTQLYGDAGSFITDVGAQGDPDGSVTVAGRTWQRLQTSDGRRRTLVRTDGAVTTVVTGTAPFTLLEQTAAALRPAKRPASDPYVSSGA